MGLAVRKFSLRGDRRSREFCRVDFSTTTLVEWEFLCGALFYHSRIRSFPYGSLDSSQTSVPDRVSLPSYLDDFFLVRYSKLLVPGNSDYRRISF